MTLIHLANEFGIRSVANRCADGRRGEIFVLELGLDTCCLWVNGFVLSYNEIKFTEEILSSQLDYPRSIKYRALSIYRDLFKSIT